MMMRDVLGRTMSDNEPRFETRSRENQMFSIDANINNLMKSYNMLVDAKEFGRAQEVADQIDQLQQQKIAIQAQNVPFMMESGPLTDLSNKIGPMMGTLGAMGESGRTISNRGRQIVENILQDISL
jgi:Cft2 family RNA processing exonuclease